MDIGISARMESHFLHLPYLIAPYAAGELLYTVSYDDLKDIVKVNIYTKQIYLPDYICLYYQKDFN